MQGTVTHDVHSGDHGGSSCGNRFCASRPLYTVHMWQLVVLPLLLFAFFLSLERVVSHSYSPLERIRELSTSRGLYTSLFLFCMQGTCKAHSALISFLQTFSTNLVEFITVYVVCPDEGGQDSCKFFGQPVGWGPNAGYNGSSLPFIS